MREDNELKVATYDAGQWVATSVDGNASTNVGLDTSTFIDTRNDFVHVAYYDLTNKDLKYAVRDASGNWNVSTLDSSGNVGQSSSIVVDSNGDCHIAYIGDSYSSLKYYACSGATSSNSGSGGGTGGGKRAWKSQGNNGPRRRGGNPTDLQGDIDSRWISFTLPSGHL